MMIREISPTNLAWEIIGGLNASYEYNANGDQISGTINGVKRTITYTSYSKPKDITLGSDITSFFYNANRDSFMRIDKHAGQTTTTLNLDNYEIVSIDDGKSVVTQQKHYIGPNTLYVKTNDGKQNTYTLLKDALGSVSDITDENANVVQHFYYAPFGEQKLTKGVVQSSPITHQGFTGHEQIENMNLIHMGGRLYDPVLGRFLTADPTIQEPDNGQELNSYS
jgi:RHS repeat-associated protein